MNLETIIKLKRGFQYSKLWLRYLSPAKLKNFLINLLERKWNKIELVSKPYVLKIEPTNNCNLNCLFCDERVHSKRIKGFMNFEKFKKMIDYFAPTTFLCSLHMWGESLLHPNILEMIEYSQKKRIGTILSSNLNHLTEEIAEGLILSGLDILVVSLDGASQETYQKYRVNGSFHKVIQNLELLIEKKNALKQKKPVIELQCLVMQHNEKEMGKLKDLAKKLKVDFVKFAPFYVYNDKYMDWLPSNKKMRFKSYTLTGKKTAKKCWWLWGSLNINWDGSIVPCCLKVFNLEFGNIFSEHFEDIWNNQHFKKARRLFTTSQNDKSSPCSECKQYIDLYY